MPKIKLVTANKEIEVPAGANLRQEIRKADVPLYRGFLHRVANCRGLGLCGTCWVLVKKGMENLTPKGFMEKFRLALSWVTIGQEGEIRLACQVKVNGDCEIATTTPMNASGENFWAKPYPNK